MELEELILKLNKIYEMHGNISIITTVTGENAGVFVDPKVIFKSLDNVEKLKIEDYEFSPKIAKELITSEMGAIRMNIDLSEVPKRYL